MLYSGIILAGGNSKRFTGNTPKQFMDLSGKMVFAYSVETFINHPSIDEVIVVLPEKYLKTGSELFPEITSVKGGKTRRESALIGLNSCSTGCDYVLIHDAARPFVSHRIIDDCLNSLSKYKAVTPVIPIINTPVRLKGDIIKEMPERASFAGEQTPQGFHYKTILDAHTNFKGQTTDDIRLVFSAGIQCVTVEGHENNFKITTMPDLLLAHEILKGFD